MGLINFYNQFTNEHKEIKAEGKIKDILPDLDFTNALILKAGNRISPDYEITKEDVLYIRQTPATATTLATIGILVGVVAVGVGIGSIIHANKMNEELKDAQEKAQKKAQQIETLPFLKGSQNQSALGQTIPFVMGTMYHTPYYLNKGYYSIGGVDGSEQFWNVALASGYNPQKIEKMYIKDSLVKEFDSSVTVQDNIYELESQIYQDSDGNAKVEICSDGNLMMEGLNQKVVPEVYSEEVVHNYGENAIPLIKELSENAQKVEICIRFDGLREYDSSTGNYVQRSVKVAPYWSNDNGTTWNQLYFDIRTSGLTYTYTWHTATDQEIAQALTQKKILKQTTSVDTHSPYGTLQKVDYISNSADWTVELVSRTLPQNYSSGFVDVWKIQYRTKNINPDGDNIIKRNTNKTVRFIATKTFSASESYGKKILVKLVRETPKKESNCQETCVLDYIQTFCFDAKKSSSTELVPCSALKPPFNNQVLKLGLRLKATKDADNYIDQIHIITSGMARTWNGTTWSVAKTVTRNPASWILELMTSDTHTPSKIQDSDIDLESFGRLYEDCVTNNYYCDSIITKGQKKSDIISGILATVFADLIINSEGKYEIVMDRPEQTPVAMLTSENVKSITYAKTFEREITGKKVTYTDRNNWTLSTEYFMRDVTHEYDQTVDSLLELNLDYVTTHDHAYKIAQRQMRQLFLQPREITVDVGLEGDYYPLYSKVLLQLEKLKIGLKSSVIRGTTVIEDSIVKISLADSVSMENGKRYGVIIQAQSDSGRKLFYKEVVNSGSGLKTELTLISAIDTTTESIVPLVNNLVAFGELNSDGTFTKVTNEMKIVGIESGSDNGFTLKLKDYNSALYEVGTIPAYKSNYTKQPDKTVLVPEYATKSEVEESQTDTVAQVVEEVSPLVESIATPIIERQISTVTPRYRGTVESLPDVDDYNNGDWIFLKVAADTNEIGLYKKDYDSESETYSWTLIEYASDGSNDSYFNSACSDLLSYYTSESTEVGAYARAYINHLFVNKITIGENGSIQSSNYSEENGTGFMLDSATGDIKANNGYFRGNISTPELLGTYDDLNQTITKTLFKRDVYNKNKDWVKRIVIYIKGLEKISASGQGTFYRPFTYKLCDVIISTSSYTSTAQVSYTAYGYKINGFLEDFVEFKFTNYISNYTELAIKFKIPTEENYSSTYFFYSGNLYMLSENLDGDIE